VTRKAAYGCSEILLVLVVELAVLEAFSET